MSGSLSSELSDSTAMAALARLLVRHARYRYRIRSTFAEDLVQPSVLTFLEGGERFATVPNHNALLFGIFRRKCLEHIDRSVREAKRLRRMVAKADVARENPWIRPTRPAETASVVEGLIHDEERRQIRLAVASLRPSSQRLVALMVEAGFARPEMIRLTGLNRNTFDSRLHVCRNELRNRLRERSLPSMKRTRRDGELRLAQ